MHKPNVIELWDIGWSVNNIVEWVEDTCDIDSDTAREFVVEQINAVMADRHLDGPKLRLCA